MQNTPAGLTHFSPTPSADLARWYRVSVCGVTTRIGDAGRAGSSNPGHVTCPVCMASEAFKAASKSRRAA